MEPQIIHFSGSRLRDGTPRVTASGDTLNSGEFGGTKFEWGYDGGDPDTTALAILTKFSGGDLAWATRHFQEFRRRVVSKFDEGEWRLSLYPEDVEKIQSGQYVADCGVVGGWKLVANDQKTAPTIPRSIHMPSDEWFNMVISTPFAAPVEKQAKPFPDPALERPRVHYYELRRKSCPECGCDDERRELKLVTYSVPVLSLNGKSVLWVRGAALRNPTDPASRLEGRKVARERALEAAKKLEVCRTTWDRAIMMIAKTPGVRISTSLEELQAEEKMLRLVEQAPTLTLTRAEVLGFYHEFFANKIENEFQDYKARLTRETAPLSKMATPQRPAPSFFTWGPELFHLIFSPDQQAPAADQDLPAEPAPR